MQAMTASNKKISMDLIANFKKNIWNWRTIAQLIFLPLAYLFGWLSKTYSVFQASYLLIAIAFLGLFGIYKVFIQTKFSNNTDLETPIIDHLPR